MMNTLSAWLVLLTYLAFALPPWRAVMVLLSRRAGDWSVGVFLLPYLMATNLRPELNGLLRMGVFIALPTILLRLRPSNAKPFDVFHVLTILSIWLPIEPDLFLLGFDLLPDVGATLMSGVNLPIPMLTAILLTLFLFLVHHPLPNIGFNFRWGIGDLRRGFLGLFAFSVIGMPLGLIMGFLRYKLDTPQPLDAVVALVAGYLLVVLPVEMLFRGIIQNLLSQRFGEKGWVYALAAVIFGLAHLNNASTGFQEPNWAYALMATIAGLAYGWVWRRSQKVTVSAITHAMVNFIWGIVFSG